MNSFNPELALLILYLNKEIARKQEEMENLIKQLTDHKAKENFLSNEIKKLDEYIRHLQYNRETLPLTVAKQPF
jgi:type II restriction/modification system DNA methylase subunit YeeA